MSEPLIESRTIVQRRMAHDLVPVPPATVIPEAEGLEVFQLLTLLRQNKRFIFRVGVLAFIAVLAVTLLSSMRFESTARLYLGELEKQSWAPSHATDEMDLSGGGHGDTATEIEILGSRTLINRAILASGLNVDVKPPGWSPPRYWRWLSSLRSPSLLEGATRELGAVETSLSDNSISRRSYDVRFTSNVDYEVEARPPSWPWHAPPKDAPGRGRLGEPLEYHGLTLKLVPGTSGGPHAGSWYTVEVRSLADVSAEATKALDIATPVTKVPIPGDTVKVADLKFAARSPELAARFLDCLMQNYLEERHSWETENATAAEAFVTTQLATIRGNLDDVQKKLADYRATHAVVVLDDEAKALVEIGKFEQQRFDTRIELETLGAVDSTLRRPNAPIEAYMFSQMNDPVLTNLATSLSQTQQKLAETDSRFNAAAPDLKEQRAQMDSQVTAIRNYVTNRLARSRDTLSKLDGIIGQYEEKLRSVPSAELGLAQLARESEVYSNVYSFLLKRQQETAITKASTISKNRILDSADVPNREKWPAIWLPAIGLVMGLLIGAIAVLLRGQVSGRLQSSSDVKRYLGRVPVVATIPHVAIPRKLSSSGPMSAREAERLSAVYLEAFRTLRTNLYDARTRGFGNVVLFTSPSKGDGKTTCAYSLASTLARAGRSVLLVDTDLHDGLARRVETRVGGRDLRGVLEGSEQWRDAVVALTVPPGSSFHVVRGGGPASAELLLTTALRSFITEARAIYDFVLLDSTSFPGLSDALVLTPLADCVLTVIRLEHTHRKAAAENVYRLATTASSYGIILNDVRV